MNVYSYKFTLKTSLSFGNFLNLMLSKRAEDVPEGKSRWLYALYHLPNKQSVVKSIEAIEKDKGTLEVTVDFTSPEWKLWFHTMLQTSK